MVKKIACTIYAGIRSPDTRGVPGTTGKKRDPGVMVEKQTLPSPQNHDRKIQCNVYFCPSSLKSNLLSHTTFAVLEEKGGES